MRLFGNQKGVYLMKDLWHFEKYIIYKSQKDQGFDYLKWDNIFN